MSESIDNRSIILQSSGKSELQSGALENYSLSQNKILDIAYCEVKIEECNQIYSRKYLFVQPQKIMNQDCDQILKLTLSSILMTSNIGGTPSKVKL